MRQILLELQESLKHLKGGASSSKSHLNAAIMDWNIEQNWDRDNAHIITVDGEGYAFFTITKREPRHCCLRHIFVLEDSRGSNIGKTLMYNMYDTMRANNVHIIRLFANKPAIKFYERLGYKWLGESKQGLPFTYTDINTMNVIHNEKQLKRLYKVYEN